ncbi:MAG: PDZ domain-containing protein [Sulfuricaulis sp.]|nr:PDZ domain-containing protein [Sulfuricaulis sp.]
MGITEVITNPRVRQWLPGILNGGMLLLLTASLAQWTWLLVKPSMPPLIVAPESASTPTSSFTLQPLLAAHLFGQASQELSVRRLDNLPLSSLNLILAGVIASSAGGYALISVNGQSQEPFAVGQAVTENAILQAVYPDRVVIRRHGTLESLLLEGTENSPPSQAQPTPEVNQSAAVPDELVRKTAPNQYTVARDKLSEHMRTPDFLSQATLIPSSGGGFLVRHIQPGSLYQKLGLRVGDVIKSINGQPLNTAEDAVKLYQQMASLNSVNLGIMRSGRSESLTYLLAQN